MDSEKLKNFVKLEGERRRLKAWLERVSNDLEKCEAALLKDFEHDSINQVRVGRLLIYLHQQLWAGAVDGNYEAACAALRAAGLGDLVQERFNTNTLYAYVRELDREGQPLPPAFEGAIKVTEEFKLRTRRSTNGKAATNQRKSSGTNGPSLPGADHPGRRAPAGAR